MSGGIYIIAEAGVNHNGSIEIALRLVDAAAESGADAVKFQTFKAEKVATGIAPKAQYQKQTTDKAESQIAMLAKLELRPEHHKVIINHCNKKKITFLSTPFEAESLEFLNFLGVPLLKLPSGEITNGPLLLEAARTGKPIILSTGMSNLAEIEKALEILAFGYTSAREYPSWHSFRKAYRSEEGRKALKEKVTLLHCTTEYPAPFEDVNLLAMDTMRKVFGLQVGYSDHTIGITVPIAAAARGAKIIEKHFTLDHNLPGPDHKASLEPMELKAMVDAIRQVELSLGVPQKIVSNSEEKNRSIVRKSLVAAQDIRKGELFDNNNLTVKRAGKGISPMEYWDWLGKTAKRDYNRDELICDG